MIFKEIFILKVCLRVIVGMFRVINNCCIYIYLRFKNIYCFFIL